MSAITRDHESESSAASAPTLPWPTYVADDNESSGNSQTLANNNAFQGFEEVGHSFIGKLAFDSMVVSLQADKDEIAKDILKSIASGYFQVHAAGGLQANFIVAAPDFCGAELPISSGGSFDDSFKAMQNENPDTISEIIKRIKADAAAIRNNPQKRPRIVLEGRAAMSSVVYSWITTSFKSFRFARYLKLAETNFDHFGRDARIAYHSGHKAALQDAWKLRSIEKNEAARDKIIHSALAKEFFALHFLSDLFAAGHVRTPRRALYNYVNKHLNGNRIAHWLGMKDWMVLKIAGLLAKAMYDEDNKKGLVVNSKHRRARSECNEDFVCYGDNYYFEDKGANGTESNTDNALECHKACCTGLADIVQMLKYASNPDATTPDFEDPKYFTAELFIPEEVSGKNHIPMFSAEGPTPAMDSPDTRLASARHCVRDADCKLTTRQMDFEPWKVLASLQFKLGGIGNNMEEEMAKLQDEMGALHSKLANARP